MRHVLLIAVAAVLGTNARAQIGTMPGTTIGGFSFRTFQSGPNSLVRSQSTIIMETEGDFENYWVRSLGRDAGNAPSRSVDWSREKLIALHIGERRTSGFSVYVQSAKRLPSGVVQIVATERTPIPGQYVAQSITSPYIIIRVPRGSYEVEVDYQSREGGNGLIVTNPWAGGIIVQPGMPTSTGIGGVSFRTFQAGQTSRAKTKALVEISSENDFVNYWRNMLGRNPAATPSQNVDWMKEKLLAIHIGERRTGGYSVYVLGIGKGMGGATVVRAIERTPIPGQYVSEAVTSPYIIVKVPRSAGGFTLDLESR